MTSPPKNSEWLGNLLQWLAGADPGFVRDLEQIVRVHIAEMLQRQDDVGADDTSARLGEMLRWLAKADPGFLFEVERLVRVHIEDTLKHKPAR